MATMKQYQEAVIARRRWDLAIDIVAMHNEITKNRTVPYYAVSVGIDDRPDHVKWAEMYLKIVGKPPNIPEVVNA